MIGDHVYGRGQDGKLVVIPTASFDPLGFYAPTELCEECHEPFSEHRSLHFECAHGPDCDVADCRVTWTSLVCPSLGDKYN